MKLTYYKAPHSANFGDDLNAWMWPRLLPGFFDEDDSEIFLGIGSIIGNKQPDGSDYAPHQKRIVFGSGFVADYHDEPDMAADNWDVFFVRGPETAKALNLPENLGIGDSAILLRALIDDREKPPPEHVGFMPHWQSLDRGNWEEVCEKAGLKLIDPRLPVEDVLTLLLKSSYIVTEAMHGAIVADALRVPWICAQPIEPLHRRKWGDWAQSLSIDLKGYTLIPSSLNEAKYAIKYKPVLKLRDAIRNLRGNGNASADSLPHQPEMARPRTVPHMLDRWLINLSAYRLKEISKQKTTLSSDLKIARATDRMLGKLRELKEKYEKSAVGQKHRGKAAF